MEHMRRVRKAAVAGSFYPGDPVALQGVVSSCLSQAGETSISGPVYAIMVPHAGYVFSGQIAAYGYRALEKADYDTLVIIGHDFGHNAPGISAIFSPFDAYETPLGTVEVDRELQEALMARLEHAAEHPVHAREHTIEVHLPFLLSLGRPFKIVPILFGEVTSEHCRQLADALLACEGDRRIAVIASSDMTHYPPYEVSREIDDETLGLICSGQLERLCRRADFQEPFGTSREARRCTLETPLCATGGVGVAMLWAQAHGADSAVVLKKGSSGDSPRGEKDRVVGYSAVAFARQGTGEEFAVDAGQARKVTQDEFTLSQAAREALLQLVRQRIEARAQGQPKAFAMPAGLSELTVPAAAFVTLKKDGRLRGCIGTTEAHSPLWETIEYFAEAAAFEDPRFCPVTSDEVGDLSIEISVLSPLEPCTVQEIRPFRDGVVVRSGSRSGLFLPQVWEQLPQLDSFMGYLCSEKAGLPYDAWKDAGRVKLYRFTVVAFQD